MNDRVRMQEKARGWHRLSDAAQAVAARLAAEAKPSLRRKVGDGTEWETVNYGGRTWIYNPDAFVSDPIDWDHNLYDEDYWGDLKGLRPLIEASIPITPDAFVNDSRLAALSAIEDAKEYEHDRRLRGQYE